MSKFTWTAEQRARLVPGAIVTVHWIDSEPTRETVNNVSVHDTVTLDSGRFTCIDRCDPESVVSP